MPARPDAGVQGGPKRRGKGEKPCETVLPNATHKQSSLIHHTITTRAPLMEVYRWRDEIGSLDVTPIIERKSVEI